MYDYAKNAEKNNIAVIIAGAGGSAHLPRNDFGINFTASFRSTDRK